MTAAALSDRELIDAFEAATLPAEVFRHAQHVRVAWLLLTRDGMPDVLTTFSAALRRFAIAKGAPKLYHVTVTWAYLLLIHQRQQLSPAADWETFAAANPDLLTWRPSILERYYSPETLWSDFARHTFVMPDRVTLA